ncbi:hypothetical protein CHCC14820_2552 [Bacillus paralicheniformis]|nr:hypothetical protein CHCC20347_4477 [Bacillus paralicheniformis]TWM32175.1 hypothetical protein CHCC14820_2552 [Bacillus paralicheniformis]
MVPGSIHVRKAREEALVRFLRQVFFISDDGEADVGRNYRNKRGLQ